MKPRGVDLAGAREERLFGSVVRDGADDALHRSATRALPSPGEFLEDEFLKHAAKRSKPGASVTQREGGVAVPEFLFPAVSEVNRADRDQAGQRKSSGESPWVSSSL